MLLTEGGSSSSGAWPKGSSVEAPGPPPSTSSSRWPRPGRRRCRGRRGALGRRALLIAALAGSYGVRAGGERLEQSGLESSSGDRGPVPPWVDPALLGPAGYAANGELFPETRRSSSGLDSAAVFSGPGPPPAGERTNTAEERAAAAGLRRSDSEDKRILKAREGGASSSPLLSRAVSAGGAEVPPEKPGNFFTDYLDKKVFGPFRSRFRFGPLRRLPAQKSTGLDWNWEDGPAGGLFHVKISGPNDGSDRAQSTATKWNKGQKIIVYATTDFYL